MILAALNLKIAEAGCYENFLVRCHVKVRFKVTRHVSEVFKHLFLSKIALQLKRKLFCHNALNPDLSHQEGTIIKPLQRREVVTSRCHGSRLSGSQQTVVQQISQKRKTKKKKNDIYPFPAHHCTEEQNGSPYFSSIIRECKWPSLSRTRNFANMVT